MEQEKFTNLPQQETYASILQVLVNVSLALIIATFILYAGGFLEPTIPIEDLPAMWSMPLTEFIAANGSPTGWDWVNYTDKGDYLNLVGIAFMGATSGICYLILLYSFLKEKNNIAAIIATLELVLFLLAASNILNAGGH